MSDHWAEMHEPYRLAPVIDMFERVTPAEREIILARRSAPRGQTDLGIDALRWIGMTDKRDAIRIYARLGLHPIAVHGITPGGECTCNRVVCETPGKHPIYKGWESASLDIERLDRQLIANPLWNIGLRQGLQPNGDVLVTIDIDGDRSLLDPLEAELGPLPPTLTARSGSGGWHMIYRVPAGRRPPRNKVKLSEHVDVRGEGGQIVAAPSRHLSGGVYRWVDVRAPEVLP